MHDTACSCLGQCLRTARVPAPSHFAQRPEPLQKEQTLVSASLGDGVNVSPAVLTGPSPSGNAGEPALLNASFSDRGVLDAPWLVTWDFGDGSAPVEFDTSTQGDIGTNHVYANPGTFTATVSVRDKDDDIGTARAEVVVIARDLDDDGIFDDVDRCPSSNLTPTVLIDGCESASR